MTVEQQQEIIDQVMRRMAVRHGSSTRRDFEVACLVIDIVIGSGTDSAQAEHSADRAGAQAQK